MQGMASSSWVGVPETAGSRMSATEELRFARRCFAYAVAFGVVTVVHAWTGSTPWAVGTGCAGVLYAVMGLFALSGVIHDSEVNPTGRGDGA